jgi:MFS family permease
MSREEIASPSDVTELSGSPWVLMAMVGAVGLITASTVITTTTIPEIGRALRASQSQLQWIADVYPLVLASLLLPAGAVLDRFGRKRGLIWGLGILAASLAWSAITPTPDQLIASRCCAGVGAALAFPGTLATISSSFSAAQRGRAVGTWAFGFMAGGLFGVLIGGGLVELYWWGASFLVTAALVVACLLLILLVVPETRDPGHSNFDPIGALLSCVGIGAVVLAVTEEPILGWTDALTVGGLVVGVAGLIAFAAWEIRTSRPLLDLRRFRDPSFGTASATLFVMFMVDFALFFLCFQYEAYILGYGPFKSVLGLMPEMITLPPVFVFAPAIANRFGRRLMMTIAMALCATGALSAALVGHDGRYWPFTLSLSVFWTGVALAMGPSTEAIIEAMPSAEQGVASAVNDIARELGAALGIAVLGSAFNAGYRRDVGHLLGSHAGHLRAAITDSPATGLQAVARLGAAGRPEIAIIHSGVFAGWNAALVVATALLIAVAIFVAIRYPGKADNREQRAPEVDAGQDLVDLGASKVEVTSISSSGHEPPGEF